MPTALKLITAPAAEPLSLSDFKAHARITATAEDTLLPVYVKAAREQLEHETGRALITQTWELTLDAFPGSIWLPKPPLQSVTSIKYDDAAGVEQTLSNTVYDVLNVGAEYASGAIVLADGETWPVTSGRPGCVRVRYVCGYGAAGSVPETLVTWIRLQAAALAEHREAVTVGERASMLPGRFIAGLLDRYRVAGL